MRLTSSVRVLADIPRLLRHPRGSREQIVAFQEQRLRRLVTHAYNHVPYYRRLFDDAGIKPRDIQRLADLEKIPITTKATLQSLGGSDMITRGIPMSSLIRRQTNGSTGIPLSVYRQRAEQLLPPLFLWRVRRDLSLSRGVRVTALVKGSYRARSRSAVSKARRQLQRLTGFRQWTRVDSTLPIDQVATLLRESNPDVISGYPGVLSRLARHLADEKNEIRPRLVVSASELLTPTVRERIESVFQAPVRDIYACYEFGLIAWECPLGGTYHVCDDNAIIEIEGEDSAHSGELIGTSLHFAAMPIIRYRLGDIVTRGPDRCACGSPFSTLSAITGRTIDYFPLADGRLLHPHLLAAAVSKGGFEWMHQYQIVQERRDRVVMRVIPRRQPAGGELLETERAGSQVLGPHVQFEVQLVDAIPDDPSGKFCAYRSLVECD
jgi:phenylacetate-CoA ligase